MLRASGLFEIDDSVRIENTWLEECIFLLYYTCQPDEIMVLNDLGMIIYI